MKFLINNNMLMSNKYSIKVYFMNTTPLKYNYIEHLLYNNITY